METWTCMSLEILDLYFHHTVYASQSVCVILWPSDRAGTKHKEKSLGKERRPMTHRHLALIKQQWKKQQQDFQRNMLRKKNEKVLWIFPIRCSTSWQSKKRHRTVNPPKARAVFAGGVCVAPCKTVYDLSSGYYSKANATHRLGKVVSRSKYVCQSASL